MSCPARTYPLKRPNGHQPPVPRWHLQFDDSSAHVYTAYIGVQLRKDNPTADTSGHSATEELMTDIIKTLRTRVIDRVGDGAIEEFESMDWNEEDVHHVFVCYWNSQEPQVAFVTNLNLRDIHRNLPDNVRPSIGFWVESFGVPISRLETNYSGLDYLPGFARLPKTRAEEHKLTAYWGAARDRLGASAHDLFEAKDKPQFSIHDVDGEGTHIVAYNADNMVHIRTGQYWENCPEEEIRSYEDNLEPTLRKGLSYLRSTPSTGASGLRYLRNIPSARSAADAEPLKETSVTGFFTSLDALETWAKRHKSHLAIYNGAMKHAKKFGPDRKFRTWHEVVVLKDLEGRFEYLNCEKGTGVLERIKEQLTCQI